MKPFLNSPEPLSNSTQRFERPFNIPPGSLKQQLPGKILQIGARGDLTDLERLLADHPEYLSKRGNHNRTLLWEATRKGKLAAVKWLVERGADVNATGCYNNETLVQVTPYCAAIYYHRPAVAEYLRSHGAQEDIFRLAFLGKQSEVIHELDKNPNLLNAEDPLDDTYYVPLLAFAVAGEQSAMVKALLQRGPIVKPYTTMLLWFASRHTSLDILKELVASGADPALAEARIYVGISNLRALEYLLQHGASSTQTGKNGFPPLVYAARADKREDPEKIRLLLEYKAPVNVVGPKGRTALHQAAAAGHLRVIKVLLEYHPDLNLRDEDGLTPLELARLRGKTAAVALLEQAAH